MSGGVLTTEEDMHPREDVVQMLCRELKFLDCVTPVDPYDPEDIYSVASQMVWALMREGLLVPLGPVPTPAVSAEGGVAQITPHDSQDPVFIRDVARRVAPRVKAAVTVVEAAEGDPDMAAEMTRHREGGC